MAYPTEDCWQLPDLGSMSRLFPHPDVTPSTAPPTPIGIMIESSSSLQSDGDWLPSNAFRQTLPGRSRRRRNRPRFVRSP